MRTQPAGDARLLVTVDSNMEPPYAGRTAFGAPGSDVEMVDASEPELRCRGRVIAAGHGRVTIQPSGAWFRRDGAE